MCAALVSSGISSAIASDAALDFKGLRLGSSYSEFASNNRFRCSEEKKSPLGDATCSYIYGTRETVADAAVIWATFYFYDGALARVSVLIDEADFDQVLAAYLEKYGRPASTRKGSITTRMGAKLNNELAVWTRASGSIELRRRTSADVTQSSITYEIQAADRLYRDRAIKAQKRGAQDL